MDYKKVTRTHKLKVNGAETFDVPASSAIITDAVDVSQCSGDFSIQWECSGSGTIKFEALMSLDRINWILPSGASAIITSVTTGSGIKAFDATLGVSMKIRITESGGSAQNINKLLLATQ